MFCEHCGAQLEEGAVFCQNCGAKVAEGAKAPCSIRFSKLCRSISGCTPSLEISVLDPLERQT